MTHAVWLIIVAVGMLVGMNTPSMDAALVLEREGQPEAALELINTALADDPNNAEMRTYRGTLRLMFGDYVGGFDDYEWRWKCEQYKDMPTRPRWDGSPLPEQTLLLHSEQGFGDSFQFVRYAALAKPLCGRVVLRCPKPLATIMRLCPLLDDVSEIGSAMPTSSAETTLMSLPHLFGTTIATVPASVPYLLADEAISRRWREVLPPGRLRVGINWKGRAQDGDWSRRDIPLSIFEPLSKISGVQLVRLQKKEGDDFDRDRGAFMDTTAVMKICDLVITSDTSIAHLAGGLGVKTWVCLPFASEWRWMLNREDSPWYPTMRLFRQRVAGDWDEVFTRIADELRKLA